MSAKKNQPIPARGDLAANSVGSDDAVVFGEAAALLALAAPQVPPPSPQVREQLLAKIRAARTAAGGEAKHQTAVAAKPLTAPAVPAAPGWRFESAAAPEGWRSAPFPGVRVKTLSVDEARDSVLLLMEMAAGSRIPDHPHDGPEEGLVISGDALNGGRMMHAGDYYRAEDGTMHTDTTSPSGCLALVKLTLRTWNAWRVPAA